MDEVRISNIARDPKELSPNLTGPQAVTSTGKITVTWGNVKNVL